MLNIYSMNCQGLRNNNKRKDVITYLKALNPDIICLQDTHLKTLEVNLLQNCWDGEVFLNGVYTNSRGVGILFKNTLQFEVLKIITDDNGNLLLLHMNCENKKLLLINVYGPNNDNEYFFEKLNEYVDSFDHEYCIICGDLNVTLDPTKDTYNYVGLTNPKARDSLLKVMDTCSLVDIYRYSYPECRRYTWRRKNPIKQARLDYFIISHTLLDAVSCVDIKTGYRTDHSLITLSVCFSNFSRGPGSWKFNTSLLRDKEYLTLVKRWINDEKLKYAVPVYNLDNIKNISDEGLQLTIEHDTFLETLLLRIRGETRDKKRKTKT